MAENNFLPSLAEEREMIDLAFEGHNQKYGAYMLRKNYTAILAVSFLITASVYSLSISFPKILEALKPAKKEVAEKVINTRVLSYTELSAPPPIVPNKPLVKKLDIEKLIQSQVKYVPPVIKPDEEVMTLEEFATMEDLENANPGIETIKGNDSIAMDMDFNVMMLDEVEIPKEEEQTFEIVEQMPSYPGGDGEFMKFLSKRIKYPEKAREMGIEGRVILQFIIASDGVIKEVTVVKGIGYGCDEEAIRVMKTSPRWKPGRQNGIDVAVKFMVPVRFRLD